MKYASMVAAALAAALSGCAAPLVSLDDVTFQHKAEYAAHWQGLSDRIVERFAATLHTSAPNVFVAPGPSDMPFAAAFKRDLELSLIRHGYPVVNSANGAEVLNFEVQPFLYRQKDELTPVDYASFWTTVGAIGSQLRHVSSIDTGVGIGLVAGPAIDIFNYMNSHTNAEVVVTISIVDAQRVHYLDSETVYAEPGDLPLYLSKFAPQTAQYTPGEADGPILVDLPVRGSRY